MPTIVRRAMLMSEALASIEFGRFRILPHRREALADGRPIELGGRSFGVLLAVIEANGLIRAHAARRASSETRTSRTRNRATHGVLAAAVDGRGS